MHRACPHCKSPSRGNTCWYGVTIHKNATPGGGDPPCVCDGYAEDVEARDRRFNRNIWLLVCGPAIVALFLMIFR